eukprot:6182014-Pleurochrysis_carterae.AAC.2
MGALDWSAAAAAMWAAQAACVGTVALLGRGGPLSLRRLWTALLMLFLAQVGRACFRLGSVIAFALRFATFPRTSRCSSLHL